MKGTPPRAALYVHMQRTWYWQWDSTETYVRDLHIYVLNLRKYTVKKYARWNSLLTFSDTEEFYWQIDVSMTLSILPSFSKCMRKNIYHGLPNKHWVCQELR